MTINASDFTAPTGQDTAGQQPVVSDTKNSNTLTVSELNRLPAAELNKLNASQLNKLNVTALKKLNPAAQAKLNTSQRAKLGLEVPQDTVEISEAGLKKSRQPSDAGTDIV